MVNAKHKILSLLLALMLCMTAVFTVTASASAAETSESSDDVVIETTVEPVTDEATEAATSQDTTEPAEETTDVQTVPDSKAPVTTGATGATGDTVYCLNEAGWSTVYCYMWTEGAGNNGAWPGQPMTNIGDNVWSYNVTGEWEKIIFNSNGQPQTGDLNYPGNGKIYNNKTTNWDVYDTSPLQIKSFAADLASPQFKETEITLSALAQSTSAVSYRFSVSGAATAVLSDYSAKSEVKWTPAVVGTYTITLDVKDADGNTNSRTLTYVIKDDSAEVKPIIKKVSPATGSQIRVNTNSNIVVTASGGNTGTKLLFYKYIIKDAAGTIVNVPYYTKNPQYTFKPTQIGTYTVQVFVQGSDNATVNSTYVYNSVTNPVEPDDLQVGAFIQSGEAKVGKTITYSATGAGGTSPYTYQFSVNNSVVQAYSTTASYAMTPSAAGTYAVVVTIKDAAGKTVTGTINTVVTEDSTPTDPSTTNPSTTEPNPAGLKGDANRDGSVDIKDVTLIQRWLAGLITDSQLNLAVCDVNGDGNIDIKDCTLMQRYIAGYNVNW